MLAQILLLLRLRLPLFAIARLELVNPLHHGGIPYGSTSIGIEKLAIKVSFFEAPA
jgi:hypothetical protein